MFSKFSKMKILNLLLVLMISVTVPLQAVSSTVFAATTTTNASSSTSSSDTSTASDESIDEWMPDVKLQDAIRIALNSTSHSSAKYAPITSNSQITKTMLTDIGYLNTGDDHVKGITDLTGLQYANKLKGYDFTGSTIEKAPGDKTTGDWSVLTKVSGTLGTIDAESDQDVDLKDLAKLDLSASPTVTYTLTNDNKIGMPNYAQVPYDKKGTAVTTLTPGENITYDPIFSKHEAYIPISNWYKGFVNADGGFDYHNMTTYPTLPNGVTHDSPSQTNFGVDLNTWGGKALNISGFDIADHVASSLVNGGIATYYNSNNTLDATVPEPTQKAQTVQMSQSSQTGTIATTDLDLGTTDASDVQIQVPTDYEDTNDTSNAKYLTADDISFDTSDLASGRINFTLTASGLKKLSVNDLTSDIMITVNGKVIDLTLTVTEVLDDWMPDANLRTQLQAELTKEKLGDLTKANLAKLKTVPTLSGISDLTGLEYATTPTDLKIIDSPNLEVLKAGNSKVLSQMTELEKVEIDDSDLGGSLAGWGLSSLSNLSSLIANRDNLTDSGAADYANDANLSVLNLWRVLKSS
ncbi:hypothetical protein ACUIJQ_01595 [Levilactobacillus hammesii]|uniref:Uncharacterized protein n=1 Tax=Levilactobacillus hammesii DSM 16381 TaxID=1423753 RepID=A0A0R1USU2_9LACO|nr:hypothetical protein [Levilactobacillus hammesii]KRL96225.1 hypothetical protein FD28_GL001979 [Levilactobacillus hammesii DSM 16381]